MCTTPGRFAPSTCGFRNRQLVPGFVHNRSVACSARNFSAAALSQRVVPGIHSCEEDSRIKKFERDNSNDWEGVDCGDEPMVHAVSPTPRRSDPVGQEAR